MISTQSPQEVRRKSTGSQNLVRFNDIKSVSCKWNKGRIFVSSILTVKAVINHLIHLTVNGTLNAFVGNKPHEGNENINETCQPLIE